MIEGSIVAIVTPFRNGALDEERLADLIEFQIAGGTHAILPCGTTGESPTLSHREHERVIELTVEVVAGRVPVMAGTGSNSTAEAISLTRFAEKAGADAALLVVPYYNKPTQEGLYRHFRKVAEETSIPLYIYNIPGRSGVNMEPETVARLAADCPSIVGIKEASGSVQQASRILSLTGPAFTLLSGEDSLNFALLAIGGRGFITVTANVAPSQVASLYNHFAAGRLEEARRIHYELEELNKAMFLETNPIPVKTALAMMGKIEEEFRLPLCPMSEENKRKLAETLERYGLLG